MAHAESTLGHLHTSHSIATAVDGLFHEDLSLDHHRRLQAYRRYWLFYLGKHWTYARDPGEPQITINYTRRLVDILGDFTFKKAFKVTIPDDPSTPNNEREDREFVRLMLEETWRRNQIHLWALEAGQQAAVTGDLFVRVSWEALDPLEEPYARADIIPSHLVFPEFGGPHGVDRKKLKRILVMNPVFRPAKQKRGQGVGFQSVGSSRTNRTSNAENQELVVMTEEWSAAEFNRDGTLKRPAMVQFFEDKEPLGPPQVNPLGEIPIVHIPNYPLSGEFYGISDMVDTTEINRELNEKATDISDIINYHGSPVTIVTGAKLKDLERGANRIWGLPEGSSVSNLELSGDLTAANTHWNTLKDSLFELSGVPEAAMGKLQHISNTAGVALSMQYLPLMEKRNVKVLTFSLGLRLINRMMLKITSLKDSGFGQKFDALKGNKYRNEIMFPDPMPQDEAAELEKSRARLDMGLSTRRRELEKMGHSQDEVKTIIDDALKEMQEETERMFDMGPGRGENQNSRGGDPAVRGAKVSATAGKKGAIGG